MVKWQALSLSAKAEITTYFKKFPQQLSDYSFTNFWMWNQKRDYHFAEINQHLCFYYYEKEKLIFLIPTKEKVDFSLLAILKKEANLQKQKFFMRAISEEMLNQIAFSLDPSQFIIEEEFIREDYIYCFKDLLHLGGDRYQAKRNLINQFKNLYSFEYKPLSLALIPAILDFEKKSSQENKTDFALQQANEQVLKHFNDLDLMGGVLFVEQKIIAYTVGEYYTKKLVVIHIEKALKNYKGAYQMINQQFLQTLKEIELVNREESLGIEGLIKVKNSYHPLYLLKKFTLSEV